ncbi:MAG: MarC family protein [Desulfobacterales bacterium]
MTVVSAAILLFLVMDPFGNIPVFMSILKLVPPERRQRIIFRELLIALFVLVVFLFAGPYFLNIMHISEPSLRIAGGIVLFLIAIKMVFGEMESMFKGSPQGEPLIVPLAVPAIAGPSAMGTILLLMGREPSRLPEWMLSLFLAWLASAVILLLSSKLYRILGEKVLNAVESLMGLILTAISVELLLQGIRTVFEI